MAISYQDALATLEAMFGDPWTRETLSAVLQHEKGHMENTCERILDHGSQDPKLLVAKLKEKGVEPQVASDEALARQLQGDAPATGGPTVKQGRGTPTELPADFLRIPGYKHRSAASTSAGGSASSPPVDDAALARMLQDELFSEELARNPDFAHLARGGNQRARSARNRPPGQRRSATSNAQPPMQNPFENVKVMENLSSK